MIAATTTSSGFNPISIFSILQYPFGWVLQELVKVFTQVGPLKAIGAFGLAVIVLTIGIRAVLFPIFGWQLRTSRRIQAEQRLRFEAELERRLRQVRDLRQELENTRKSTAAQLAEREQEVLTLRNQIREQGAASKGRGLFRR